MRRLAGTLAVTGILLAGCGVTASDLPLPGSDVSGETYEVNAVFTDALNLPEKARVKLDGVVVGTVESISAKDFTARVRMVVQKSTQLPQGTTAELRQATPLGDVFVALHRPAGGAGPALAAGATIDLGSTSSAATVEDTLAALSTLINGGGLGQLKTITNEVNKALDGKTDQARDLINQLDTTVKTLNARTGDINRILASARSLTALAQQRQGTIDAALSDITPALKVLSDQTGKFTEVLSKVADAGDTGARVLGETSSDLKAMLNDLGPVLDGFNGLKDNLGPTLRTLVVLGKLVEGATKGESGAGNARFAGITSLPGFDGRIPGIDDLNGALGTVSGNITDLIKKLGGTR
ncbi:MAG: Virulence factor Mce family protein [Amycolatopsis sp.]|uniref:MCE family protein n=1 Tax=Amycolatopsis sp. TaxID=37632 RepID=UPI0026108E83|nr:MCE family protein [Amycolatopsis sp.]MCU1685374.1 Virulence factor Mce family protein [Amycolatopsis sp.]